MLRSGVPETYRYIFYLVLLVGTLAYAFGRGGAPERLAALVILMDVILSAFAQTPFRRGFFEMETGILFADGAAFAGLTVIAIYADRFWPTWMAGIKLVQVLSHLPINVPVLASADGYRMVQALLSYPELILLVAAVRRHRQRLATHGSDRPWSGSSSLS